MSGHSKWANTKHRKSRQDKKKNKLFNKIIKELIYNSSLGNNPNTNNKLKLSIEKALINNISKKTINNIINRKNKINNFKNNNLYEIKGPFNTLFIIEFKNNINFDFNIINKKILFYIKKYGLIILKKNEVISNFKCYYISLYKNVMEKKIINEDKIINFCLNFDIEDIKIYFPNKFKINIVKEKFNLINKNLTKKGFSLLYKKKIFKPINKTYITKLSYLKLINFIKSLKKKIYIKNIFHNIHIF